MSLQQTDYPACAVGTNVYTEIGQHVPKILPCSHTMCNSCIEKITRRSSITCPECRKRHRALNGERTFPQNKFALDVIKILKQRNVNANSARASRSPELCPDHDRELSLRCDSDTCGKTICQVCLLEEHRNHTDTVVDVLLEGKRIKLGQILRDLNRRNQNLRGTREDVVKRSTDSLEKLERVKRQIEEWIKVTRDDRDKVSRDISEKMNEVEESIIGLSRIRDNGQSSKNLVKTVEKAEKMFREQMLQYTTHQFDDSRFDIYCQLDEAYSDVLEGKFTDLFPVNGIESEILII